MSSLHISDKTLLSSTYAHVCMLYLLSVYSSLFRLLNSVFEEKKVLIFIKSNLLSFLFWLMLFVYHLKKFCLHALAGVAQWTECQPPNQRVASSIPSQGTCLGCGPGPQ